MNLNLLSKKLNFDLTLNTDPIQVKELNMDALNSSLSKIFKNIKATAYFTPETLEPPSPAIFREFDVDNLPHINHNESYEVGDFTIFATEANNVATVYDARTINGRGFGQCLEFINKGTPNSYGTIGLEVPTKSTITIYAYGGSNILLIGPDGREETSIRTESKEPGIYKIKTKKGGRYNIASSGKLRIFYISISRNAVGDENSGSFPGIGYDNITGGEINETRSVKSQVTKDLVQQIFQEMVMEYCPKDPDISKTFDLITSVTATYNQDTKEATVYFWYEGKNNLVLQEYGVTSAIPYVYCVAYSSDGEYKKVKVYTSFSLYSKMIQEMTIWNNKWSQYVTNSQETVLSPTTNNKYYIVAESKQKIGEQGDNPYFDFGIVYENQENIVDEYSFSISSSLNDFFNTFQIRDLEDNGDLMANSEEIVQDGGIVIENIKINDQDIFTDEQLYDIVQEINEKIEETKKQNNGVITDEQRDEIIEEIASIRVSEAIKDFFKRELLEQYSANNSLVLFLNTRDRLSVSLEKMERISDDPIGSTEEILEEYENLLENLGISEDSTEEEIVEMAEEGAEDLINALNGADSDNEAVKLILDNLDDGNGRGLRRDLYNKMKSISDDGKDIDCEKYSTGIAEVCAKYFSTGCMNVSAHTGGRCVYAVGTSVALSATNNMSSGKSMIQSGTRSYIPIDQAQKLADGISEMYTNGTINSMVVGVMYTSSSTTPLSSSGRQVSINHKTMKVLIMIAALAGYTILSAAGLAAMTKVSQRAWTSVINKLGCKDGNDVFAMLLAAGIKASLATTMVRMAEDVANSTGVGLIIPFGP